MDEELQRQYEAADARWLEHWKRGPTHTRWERVPVQAGDPAPDVELVDAVGERARLSDFWKDGAAHVFFMRHYGCSCMKDRWAQLQTDLGTLSEAGATTVAVGMGEPERTRRFIEVRSIRVPVLCDPERKAYEAWGVIEGTVPSVLHDYEWKPDDEETGRQVMESRRDTDLRLVDNPWILPAEFIVGPDGAIRHAHRYAYCEDFPPASVLVGAIRA